MRIFGGSIRQAARAAVAGPPLGTAAPVVSPWQPVDNALGALSAATLVELFESSAYAGPVSRSLAMSVPAFARARHTLTGTAGRLPLVLMRGRAPLVDPRRPSPLEQPEAGRPRAITLGWTVDNLLCFGRAWWVVTERYADDSRPARFEWVPEWAGVFGLGGELIGHQDGRTFAPADVIRIDGPHEGILNFGARTIRAAVELDRAALRAAGNPVPSIELHQTAGSPALSDPEIDALIARWAAARAGRNGGVAYTSASIETKAHGQAVEQLLIEGRRAAAIEVARLAGVPAWVVDVGIEGSSLTYSNVASRSRELVDYGLAPYLDAIAGRLSMDDVLPRGVWTRFDTDELLRDDFGQRMTAYEVAIRSGVYTKEELRARELGTPLETGD